MKKLQCDKNVLKRELLLNPISMFFLGLMLGVGIRVLDLNPNFVSNWGKVFSQVSIWILLCTLIAIYSPTPKDAMYNVFPFCVNMLVAYYIYDDLVAQQSSTYAFLWWSAIAVLAPILAYITWFAKERGLVPRIIRWSILIISMLSSIIIFDGYEYWDTIINTILAYFLFFQKTNREMMQKRRMRRQLSKYRKKFPEDFEEQIKDSKTEN